METTELDTADCEELLLPHKDLRLCSSPFPIEVVKKVQERAEEFRMGVTLKVGEKNASNPTPFCTFPGSRLSKSIYSLSIRDMR